ncbi:MAG: hypothetical protein GXP17_10485 [Gammaproteobacteria bacterium]|nr:hypothetical protein [Gammaproteobacteria bacterium]
MAIKSAIHVVDHAFIDARYWDALKAVFFKVVVAFFNLFGFNSPQLAA